MKLVGAERADEIADPVVASAFALAEEELAVVEEEFALRKQQQEQHPTPLAPDEEKAQRIAEAAERVRQAVRDAAADGVRFSVRDPDDFAAS